MSNRVTQWAAIRHEDGTEICGSKVIVEWAKGSPRRPFIVDDSYYEDRYRNEEEYGTSARYYNNDNYCYGYKRPRNNRSSPYYDFQRRSGSLSRGIRETRRNYEEYSSPRYRSTESSQYSLNDRRSRGWKEKSVESFRALKRSKESSRSNDRKAIRGLIEKYTRRRSRDKSKTRSGSNSDLRSNDRTRDRRAMKGSREKSAERSRGESKNRTRTLLKEKSRSEKRSRESSDTSSQPKDEMMVIGSKTSNKKFLEGLQQSNESRERILKRSVKGSREKSIERSKSNDLRDRTTRSGISKESSKENLGKSSAVGPGKRSYSVKRNRSLDRKERIDSTEKYVEMEKERARDRTPSRPRSRDRARDKTPSRPGSRERARDSTSRRLGSRSVDRERDRKSRRDSRENSERGLRGKSLSRTSRTPEKSVREKFEERSKPQVESKDKSSNRSRTEVSKQYFEKTGEIQNLKRSKSRSKENWRNFKRLSKGSSCSRSPETQSNDIEYDDKITTLNSGKRLWKYPKYDSDSDE